MLTDAAEIDEAVNSADQVILPAVPFYHVNGWGIPYAAMMAGAGLVLPGTQFQPSVLIPLLEEEGVTLAAGVPTIWSDVLAARRGAGRKRKA